MIENLNKQQLAVYSAFTALSLKDRYGLAPDIRVACDTVTRMWFSSPEYADERKQANLKNEKRRVTAAVRDANRATWAKANLQPGMIVKMVGTRDGVGVRYVVAIQDDRVVCRICSVVWRNDIEGFRRTHPTYEVFKLNTKIRGVYNNWYVAHDVTTHALEKVAGLFVKNEHDGYTLQGID